MAFGDKLGRILRGRYTPFFLPIIGSLLFIGLVVLLIPDEIGTPSNSQSDEHESSAAEAPSASSSHAGDASGKTASKRRPRLPGRTARKPPAPGAAAAKAAAPPEEAE